MTRRYTLRPTGSSQEVRADGQIDERVAVPLERQSAAPGVTDELRGAPTSQTASPFAGWSEAELVEFELRKRREYIERFEREERGETADAAPADEEVLGWWTR
jgi:hypothetical protein